MLGQTVSHYRVVEKLGGGGMGVVYRAEDTKLRRAVAIKVLPPDLTRDTTAKERFVLEAQAASALDHPNICTIHEIDETPDGQLFLVMAYYPGETLKYKIDRGPLKLDEALDYGIQIAQALKKAHESGIVHRDIKPANVLVTTDGLVKVVDFGLAKLLSQSGLTQTGTTLGTVSYMSPEQTLAESVDARSDLWSLGVVLHEMIAGQVPFKGDNQLAVANAIAHGTPPPLTSVRTGVPQELDRVVARALAKSPDDRYQTAADFLSELRRVRRDSEGQSAITHAAGTAARETALSTRKASRLRIAIGIAAILLAAVAGFYALNARLPSGPSGPVLSNPQQVAAMINVEGNPSWEPNGRMIAYDSKQGVTGDIWVTQLGGGPPINRTADFPGPDLYPRWSPDGLQIAFSSVRDGGGVFLMSALAGGARKVGPLFSLTAAPPVWSPDSTELGYAVAEGNTVFLERLNLRDNKTTRIELPGREGDARIDLAWSHDGEFIAYVDARNYTAQVTTIRILRLADRKAVSISNGLTNDWSPSWGPDSRSLYFASNRGGAMDIWRQRIGDDGSPTGEAEQLTQGLEVASLAVNREGTRIAYGKGRSLANIWRLPIQPDRPATFADATQLTFDQAHVEYLDVSRDGTRLAFSSDRSGNPDIWILPSHGGADPQPFARDPTPDWNPAWSFDDRYIAFYAYRSGNRELWIQPVAGGPATQLTSGNSESVFPRFSPDGKEIVYNSRMGGATDIWIRPATAGGNARQIKLGPIAAGYPDWSPDRSWIAFQARGGIWRVPVTGGEPTAVSRLFASRPRWSPDGQWIYFFRLNTGTGIIDAWRVSADGKKEQRLTNFEGRQQGRIEGNAIDADDKYIYISWRDDVGDIWVMDIGARR
jgi:eukaryotic-like serine/threonine-protein kinase